MERHGFFRFVYGSVSWSGGASPGACLRAGSVHGCRNRHQHFSTVEHSRRRALGSLGQRIRDAGFLSLYFDRSGQLDPAHAGGDTGAVPRAGACRELVLCLLLVDRSERSRSEFFYRRRSPLSLLCALRQHYFGAGAIPTGHQVDAAITGCERVRETWGQAPETTVTALISLRSHFPSLLFSF